MRRSLSARAGVALLAGSFILAVNGPAATYQCPAHSPRAASSQTAALHHAAHGHHAPPADQNAAHCTCGSTCCCCPPAAGLPVTSAGTEWLASVRVAPAAEGHRAPFAVSRSLPFATGPPHSA